jgi:hypothetical protein
LHVAFLIKVFAVEDFVEFVEGFSVLFVEVAFDTFDDAFVDESILCEVVFFAVFLDDGFEEHEDVLFLVSCEMRDDFSKSALVLFGHGLAVLHGEVYFEVFVEGSVPFLYTFLF